MKHELIKTDDYLFILRDEEVKFGDWYLTQKNTICQCLNVDEKYYYSLEAGSSTKSFCKKINAHLPLNGAPYLDGLDVLPKIEDDINTRIGEACDLLKELLSESPPPKEFVDNKIKSLKQPKLPIAFDSHTQRFADKNNILKQWDGPRTITNSEGKTEWVGKYLFK
jgi:hypothetical protein